jgi:hypothetical protein
MAKPSQAITRWNAIVAAEMRRSGCSRTKAIQTTKRAHPASWQAMIFASNKTHDVVATEDYLLDRATDDAARGCLQ